MQAILKAMVANYESVVTDQMANVYQFNINVFTLFRVPLWCKWICHILLLFLKELVPNHYTECITLQHMYSNFKDHKWKIAYKVASSQTLFTELMNIANSSQANGVVEWLWTIRQLFWFLLIISYSMCYHNSVYQYVPML